jgi:hypothetical protein
MRREGPTGQAEGFIIEAKKAIDAAIEEAERRGLAGMRPAAGTAIGPANPPQPTAVGAARAEVGPASRDILGEVTGREVTGAPAEVAGPEWRKYLEEFARRSQLIKDDVARAQAAQRPPQRTQIGGDALNISEHGKIPNMLWRPSMIANFVLRARRGEIEPQLGAWMAERLLNPEQLATTLRELPLAQRKAYIAAILERAPQIAEQQLHSQK